MYYNFCWGFSFLLPGLAFPNILEKPVPGCSKIMECRPKIVEPQNREDWEEWWRNVCYSFQSLQVFSFFLPALLPRGGTLDFKWMGMIEWGLSTKPPKIPEPKIRLQKNPTPNFPALKVHRKQNNFGCTLMAELRSQDMQTTPRIFRLFWIPKKLLLKSSHPKIETHKNPFITSVIWNTEYPPGHSAICVNAWNRLIPETFLHSQFPEFEHKVQEKCINK